MKKLKEILNALLKKIFVKKETVQPPPPMDEQLVLFLQATWTQKQLDDLLLMNQSIMQSLKKEPFNPSFLDRRDKIHHDINKIQPIVMAAGLACAAIIEGKFGVSFCLLSGRNRPLPPVIVPPEQKTTGGIILPGQEKK